MPETNDVVNGSNAIQEELIEFKKRIELLLGKDESEYKKKLNVAIKEHQKQEEEDQKKRLYVKDSYAFITAGYGHNKRLFFSAIFVWLLQIALPILMIKDMEFFDFEYDDSLDFDANMKASLKYEWQILKLDETTQTINITKILSIVSFFFVGGESIDELRTFTAEIFRIFQLAIQSHGVRSRNNAVKHFKFSHKMIALTMRYIAALLAIFAAVFLIVSSTDAVEVILNITAVHFISTFDDLFYNAVKDGLYGKELAKLVKDLANEKRPDDTSEEEEEPHPNDDTTKTATCKPTPEGITNVLLFLLMSAFLGMLIFYAYVYTPDVSISPSSAPSSTLPEV